ncbi:unnamed protein product [Brassicogethes aeneus]|uniref:Meteorin-like protein n=1 Tax=Brassicogethes aeneus TaxID=1431903 RepID=A0A9P0AVI1_BRAAE|nr:unnamed protein product [Brassicogethes aeneus]
MRTDVLIVCLCGKRRNKLMDYYSLLLSIICLISATSASIMGDECDWTGSGLTSSSLSRGVTPVYLRCATGRVTWLYPAGALRVLLRFPGGKDFRACIKVRQDEMDVKEPAARMFLEGPRSLLPLFAYNDGGHKGIRCFNSKKGQAAIYVEATQEQSILKRVSEMDYDLQPLPEGSKGYDPTEECRPCTSSELAHAFCSSELVTRGIIEGVENRDDLQVSQLQIKVTKLIRHTAFDDFGDTSSLESNSVYDENEKLRGVTLHVARHCGAAHGTGEFVFMARSRLGALTLQCAPRLEDWIALANRMMRDGTAQCVLKS